MKKYTEKEEDYNFGKKLKKQAKKNHKKNKFSFTEELKKEEKESSLQQKKINDVLLKEIDNNGFWEDIKAAIINGADPKIKNAKGDDIQVGLIRILDAWCDSVFELRSSWSSDEGIMKINYLKKEITDLINFGVDLNYVPENKSSILYKGNLFYKISIATIRHPELAELAFFMFENGADINTKIHYFGVTTIKEKLQQYKKVLENKAVKHKSTKYLDILSLLTLDEKKQITANLSLEKETLSVKKRL